MKNTAFKFFGVAAIAVAALFSSCADPCKDVTCLNGGECVEGDCACATGYEGTDCGTRATHKFAGSFTANETCTSGSYTYSTTVTESSTDITKITFSNLYDFTTLGVTTAIYGTVSNSTTLTIPSQVVTSSTDSYTVSGSGSISSTGVITISLNVNDTTTGTSDTCTDTLNPA